MKYGVVLLSGADQATLQILAKSAHDDFPDGLDLDSGMVKAAWPKADCSRGREFPTYDVVGQRDTVGVVFSREVPAYRRLRLTKTRLLTAAALSALAGGAITALVRRRTK